jgi:hypothetical protein
MKKVILFICFVCFCSFSNKKESIKTQQFTSNIVIGSSFSLINDTKDKVSIHTGTGFVSLNKGSKTSIGCNVGKEVRWAESGKKGDVIFKIKDDMCGETLKLSDLMK